MPVRALEAVYQKLLGTLTDIAGRERERFLSSISVFCLVGLFIFSIGMLYLVV
ncbi:hypothetical protein XSR1_10056 [Xenorhabdus szentirmaii DSM 16338]|uniref:Uncharacterized protein n=1 Tax=Xenorhabdus szentirmaii DSM 16338 TaxID=1427518 RepID=W1ISH4_9GAMM|nr:hypothetical protein XSR1_10056 [Xenorhabdus szentirmaii DSM 16338]